ncbi:MAG: TonB-dependent receptor, partial [Caulobacter sp.]|nr:TonB-dependent receptor [Caulobacter sp.]
MTKTLLLATTAAALILTAAAGAAKAAETAPHAAQAPVPTGPTRQGPLDDAMQKGVLVFTPDFFAAQRPNTALDMVDRVPGFTVDDGTGARGF